MGGGDDRAVVHEAAAHALGAEAVAVVGGQDLPAELPPQLGRVMDVLGRPIDERGPIGAAA